MNIENIARLEKIIKNKNTKTYKVIELIIEFLGGNHFLRKILKKPFDFHKVYSTPIHKEKGKAQ